MNNHDKIRVRITASQRIYYDQIKEMTWAEWEEFRSLEPHQLHSQDLAGYINTHDVYDVDNIYDFEAHVVDANDKPLNPDDEEYYYSQD